MQKIFSFFFKGFAIVAISMAFVLVLGKSLRKEEKRECVQWQNWTREHKGFHPTEEMGVECQRYGVKLHITPKRVSI